MLEKVTDLRRILDFNVGEEVQFTDRTGKIISGIISRLNTKSISIVTREGDKWNVSPHLLDKVKGNIKDIPQSDHFLE